MWITLTLKLFANHLKFAFIRQWQVEREVRREVVASWVLRQAKLGRMLIREPSGREVGEAELG